MQPREVRQGYARGNGLRLRYLEWCPDEPREVSPLVCLHGIGGRAEDWGGLIEALRMPRRVIAFDARGHGGSEWSTEAAYSTDAHFADIACALEDLHVDRFTLAGYSMGGGVAILSANALAERVDAVIVVDAYPGPDMTDGSRRIAGLIARGPGLDQGKPRFDPAISAAFARDLDGGEPRRIDLWPHWDALECPTLLVRGELSRVLPEQVSRQMLTRLPRARGVTIDGAGHNLLYEPVQLVAAAIDAFLGEEDRPR